MNNQYSDLESISTKIKNNIEISNHNEIKDKLLLLKNNNNIPNIIFHGENKSGKKTILNYFINLIYNNNQATIKHNVLFINCSFNKGIKYIREDLKFFCKAIVNSDNGKFFKSIILLNGDSLTIDAQSALRRCIEIYSHNTRFFIIVENKNKLLKPIISRFASIFIIKTNFNNIQTNSNKINLFLQKNKNIDNLINLNKLVNLLYYNGISGYDVYKYFKNEKKLNKNIEENINKYKVFINFLNIKKEIKNEKLLIFYLLNNLYYKII